MTSQLPSATCMVVTSQRREVVSVDPRTWFEVWERRARGSLEGQARGQQRHITSRKVHAVLSPNTTSSTLHFDTACKPAQHDLRPPLRLPSPTRHPPNQHNRQANNQRRSTISLSSSPTKTSMSKILIPTTAMAPLHQTPDTSVPRSRRARKDAPRSRASEPRNDQHLRAR